MKHYIHIYINQKLKELKILDTELSDSANVSKGQISKLKHGLTDRLTAKTYYSIIKAFNESFAEAEKIVFPRISLNLLKFEGAKRNSFGKMMQTFEVKVNSIEEIAHKTNIDLNRLKSLYYRKSSPEAYELILIEKALGKKSGELFEVLYGNP